MAAGRLVSLTNSKVGFYCEAWRPVESVLDQLESGLHSELLCCLSPRCVRVGDCASVFLKDWFNAKQTRKQMVVGWCTRDGTAILLHVHMVFEVVGKGLC
jgi:hypothetical protein